MKIRKLSERELDYIRNDLDEGCYGGIIWCPTGWEIRLNLGYIWADSGDESKFIKLFSECLTHEHIHLAIRDELDEITMGEEQVIFNLLNTKYTDDIDKYYNQFYKKRRHKKFYKK